MATFDDPLADGEEARQALRALAHATRSFTTPAHTYEVIGGLLGGLRSLEQVLPSNPNAAPAWADLLQATIESDPRTRDSIWQGVSLALGALADPRVLSAVSPGEDEQFDPEAFLRDSGTLYLLATGAGAGASSSLVAAFVEDLVEAARRMAARSPAHVSTLSCSWRSTRSATWPRCRRCPC